MGHCWNCSPRLAFQSRLPGRKEISVPTGISHTVQAHRGEHTRCSSWTLVCICHWSYEYVILTACMSLPGTLGHPLDRQKPTHSLKAAESLLVLLNPPRGAGGFHLQFPNCPHSGKSWTFCNSFVWLLFGIIYPFSSVCSNVFHITSDILSFHVRILIFF